MVKLNTQIIRARMRERGQTTESVAWLMGISPSLLKGLLDRGTASMDHAMGMARALNAPIIEITLA